MSLKEQNPALILIDFQKGFDEEKYVKGNRNNKDAEKNASEILNHWRDKNLPVFHVIHHSLDSNSTFCEGCSGFEIKDEVKPKKGDCCVFCSYGTVKCPPIQQGKNCC